MKWICILLISTLLLCSSGIVSAGNESTTGEMTMFTDENIRNAEQMIVGSGVGDLFALLSIALKIVVWGGPVVLLITAILAKIFHKNELFNSALAGFALMIVVLLAYNLFTGAVSSLTPNLSTIPI